MLKKSALAEHCLRSGHTVSWETSKILRTNANWRNRRILEAWEINTCRNPLNRDDGMHLPHEFLNLALRDRILIIIIDSNLAYYKKRVFCELFFHFSLMKVEGSTETLGLLKHCTYSYTISTRVTFLFLNMYRLIVAPRKFDVLKTNICPRSEASRANMLVLRTSNFQGATIRPIVPRHKHSIVFIVHH